MRVLMISKACIAGAYQLKLEAIAAQGVDLTVVVPPYWRDDAGRTLPLERAHTEGYRLVVEPMVFNGHFHYHFYPRLSRLFRELRPDILHMDEEPYNLSTVQGFWLAGQVGARPLFFTWQNLLRRYPPPFSWMEHYCYARAAGALAGNAEAVEVLHQKGYHGRSWVIPQFGVDPALFHPALPISAPAAQRPFTVGFCGRLRKRKGEYLLLQAVAALGGDAQLKILGWGEEEAGLRQMAAALDMQDRFEILPALPSTEVPSFYHSIDVLAAPSLTLPSWKEQFGRVLVEAMACGVPVIGSNSGEIAHVIGAAGLLFPEGDVSALTDGLRRLRDDPALRRGLATRGIERVHANYTQRSVAEHTVAAYHDILHP